MLPFNENGKVRRNHLAVLNYFLLGKYYPSVLCVYKYIYIYIFI